MSAGSPKRGTMMFFSNAARYCGLSRMALIASEPVKMNPTMMALVRMSSLPKSTAIWRVSALMAPLDAW
jgi:hypothetical protein